MRNVTFLGVVSTFIASAILSPLHGQKPKDPLKGYDAYVTQAMKDWKVPGLAIAIVKGDSVIYAKGYGVRKLGDPSPVDAHTVFAIGSSSKAFTGALIGRLVDDGKVKWDDPVRKHLPWFEMYDRYVSRDLTIRDILTHRSGLSRGDLLWYGSSLSREEIARRVRYLKPTWPLRTTFGYQNLMFLTAGLVVEAKRGTSWDEAVRQEIFGPLGMTESHTSNTELDRVTNLASAHAERDDTVHVIPWRNIDNIGPAGSISSNVTDMAKWVRMQLDSGKVGTKTIVSSAAIAESHMPQTIIRIEGPLAHLNPYTHYESYGFGWFLHDFRGHEVVEHGGNIDGFSAMVGMLPEEKLGVVILTNMNGTFLRDVLLWYTFDRFLTDSPRDWSAEYKKVADGFAKQGKEAEKKRDDARAKDTKPSLALDKYAGTYSDSLYGEATVSLENGHLVFRHDRAFTGDLTHWHYDTFRATMRDAQLGKPMITFSLDADGKVTRMNVESISEFVRDDKVDATAAVKLSEAEMNTLTGNFTAEGIPVTLKVEAVNGGLRMTVVGQPAYTLIAESKTRFKMTRSDAMPPGFFVEFQLEGGKVVGLTLEQPAPRPSLRFKPSK